MAVSIKKFLEDNSLNMNRFSSFNTFVCGYLQCMIHEEDLIGTKIHEEMKQVIMHYFKESGELHYSKKDNMYCYTVSGPDSAFFQYYPNGLVIRNYTGKFTCLTSGVIFSSTMLDPYELPKDAQEVVDKENKRIEAATKKAYENSIKKKERQLKKTQDLATMPPACKMMLEECNKKKYALGFYQAAKWYGYEDVSTVPNSKRFPMYKFVDKLRELNDKLNKPVEITIQKKVNRWGYEDTFTDFIERNFAISPYVDGIHKNLKGIAEKYMGVKGETLEKSSSFHSMISWTRLSIFFTDYGFDDEMSFSSPLRYFMKKSDLDKLECEQEKVGKWSFSYREYRDKVFKVNNANVEKEYSAIIGMDNYAEVLRSYNKDKGRCHYVYTDHEGEKFPVIPVPSLQRFILQYDKYISGLKDIPYGEEWAIKNGFMAPKEEAKEENK